MRGCHCKTLDILYSSAMSLPHYRLHFSPANVHSRGTLIVSRLVWESENGHSGKAAPSPFFKFLIRTMCPWSSRLFSRVPLRHRGNNSMTMREWSCRTRSLCAETGCLLLDYINRQRLADVLPDPQELHMLARASTYHATGHLKPKLSSLDLYKPCFRTVHSFPSGFVGLGLVQLV